MKASSKLQAQVLAALLALMPGASAAQSSQGWDGILFRERQIDSSCSQDPLYAHAARGRTLWTAKHYPVMAAQFYSYISIGSTDYRAYFGDLESAVAAAVREWLKLPDGVDRPRPRYLLWVHADGREVWRGPTNPSSPADKPSDVHIRGLCTPPS